MDVVERGLLPWGGRQGEPEGAVLDLGLRGCCTRLFS